MIMKGQEGAIKGKGSTGGAALSGRRILVVDDEPDALTFISTVLEDNGAEILKAGDGDTAIVLARNGLPDLITLDLEMPGKSGIDVFMALRSDERTRNIPVCIITGHPELRKLIYEKPVSPPPEGFVNKPVDEKSLLINVRKVLEIPTLSARKHEA
jgi:twitching motility two-component system response regulator PilH